MHTSPLVSVVIPVYNDEDWVAAALDSCLHQSLEQIEVICVDDASTDNTREIIEHYQAKDSRIQLIRMEKNGSAFQGRRAGIMAARGEYLLFLDGDDELAPQAAKLSLAKARATNADLVGFAVEIVQPGGQTGGRYQKRLAPVHQSLEGEDVFRGLYPNDKAAQGQLWRHLYRTTLLRDVYKMLPADLILPRANDLPIMFLTAARAQKYVSISDYLYRYFFRRGGSGQGVANIAQFEYYLGAVDSVDSIRPAVESLAQTRQNPTELLESHKVARLAIIGNVLHYLRKSVSGELQSDCLKLLYTKAQQADVVTAAVSYHPEALEILAQNTTRIEAGQRPVQSVLLTTKTLTTGGVSNVLLSQAHYLLEAGYKVTIVAHNEGSMLDSVPEGAKFIELAGKGLPARVQEWAQICRDESIDVIIDQRILYNRHWPAFALMARALGVPTIGWIHNFALRPIYNRNDMSSFLMDHLNALATVVTLSPLDVAYWKMRGIEHTVYLPNPPTPLLIESASTDILKAAPNGRIELVWVGRLDEHTKRVRQLVNVAAELHKLSVDFQLTIIGPDWANFTAADLTVEVEKRRLSDYVKVVGPQHGEELIRSIDAADLFVTTSIIEGYQLTLAEAQARGLPIVMYELPWLVPVQDNKGIVAVSQGDAPALAREIASLATDPERYTQLSQASIKAAEQALSYDFSQLYLQLIQGTLPSEFSPEPTLDDAQQILDWMVFYTEHTTQNRGKTGRRKSRSAIRRASFARRAAKRAIRIFPALEPVARRVQKAVQQP